MPQDYLQNEEKQIDIMVYKLYDLNYNEVLTIDKDITLTEKEYANYVIN